MTNPGFFSMNKFTIICAIIVQIGESYNLCKSWEMDITTHWIQFIVIVSSSILHVIINKANLRDLIAATGLVILLKLDSTVELQSGNA